MRVDSMYMRWEHHYCVYIIIFGNQNTAGLDSFMMSSGTPDWTIRKKTTKKIWSKVKVLNGAKAKIHTNLGQKKILEFSTLSLNWNISFRINGKTYSIWRLFGCLFRVVLVFKGQTNVWCRVIDLPSHKNGNEIWKKPLDFCCLFFFFVVCKINITWSLRVEFKGRFFVVVAVVIRSNKIDVVIFPNNW